MHLVSRWLGSDVVYAQMPRGAIFPSSSLRESFVDIYVNHTALEKEGPIFVDMDLTVFAFPCQSRVLVTEITKIMLQGIMLLKQVGRTDSLNVDFVCVKSI